MEGTGQSKVTSTPRGLAVLREGSSVQSSTSQRLWENHMSSTRGMGKEVGAREKQGQSDSGAHVGCEKVARRREEGRRGAPIIPHEACVRHCLFYTLRREPPSWALVQFAI